MGNHGDMAEKKMITARIMNRLRISAIIPAAWIIALLVLPAGCGKDNPETPVSEEKAAGAGAAVGKSEASAAAESLEGLEFSTKYKDTEAYRLGSPLWKHGAAIMALTMSPEGYEIASAGADRSLRVFDAVNGFQITSFTTHGDRPFLDVCYSPDGEFLMALDDQEYFYRYNLDNEPVGAFDGKGYRVGAGVIKPRLNLVVTGNYDRDLNVWDIATGKKIFSRTLPGEHSLVAVDISPDGDKVAAADDDGNCHVFSLKTGRPRGVITGGYRYRIGGLAFSPDGTKLAVSRQDGSVQFYDSDTLKRIERIHCGRWGRHRIRFSPDGRRLVLYGGESQGVIVFALCGENGRIVPAPDLSASGEGKESLPDAAEAVVATGKTAEASGIVNPDERIPVERLEEKPSEISVPDLAATVQVPGLAETAAFPGLAATGNVGRQPDIACTWTPPENLHLPSPVEGKWTKLFEYDDTVGESPVSVAFHPGGKPLLVIGYRDGRIIGLHAGTGEILFQPQERTDRIVDLACNSAGDLLVAAHDNGLIRLWNPRTKEKLAEITLPVRNGLKQACVALSEDGRLLAVGGRAENADCFVYEAETGRRLYRLIGHRERVIDLAFIRKAGHLRLVSVGSDRTLRIWPLKSGIPEKVVHLDSRAVMFLEAVPGEKYVVLGTMSELRLLDADGKEVKNYSIKGGQLSAAAFSSDGKMLAVAGRGLVRVLNAADLTENASVRVEGTGNITYVAFGKGGTIIAADAAGELSTWNLFTGKRVGAPQRVEQRLLALLPAEGGEKMYLGTGDGTVVARPYFKESPPQPEVPPAVKTEDEPVKEPAPAGETPAAGTETTSGAVPGIETPVSILPEETPSPDATPKVTESEPVATPTEHPDVGEVPPVTETPIETPVETAPTEEPTASETPGVETPPEIPPLLPGELEALPEPPASEEGLPELPAIEEPPLPEPPPSVPELPALDELPAPETPADVGTKKENKPSGDGTKKESAPSGKKSGAEESLPELPPIDLPPLE